MYLLGHLALGYFFSKPFQYLGYKINYFHLAIFSLLPDIDFLIPYVTHRGPTHSLSAILVLFAITIFIPKLLPYLAAFISHILVGDLITANGVRLFWPFSRAYYFIQTLVTYENQMTVEFVLFLLAFILFVSLKEWKNT